MPAQPWLDVPFADKDAAKAAGARWDPKARRWYAPRPGIVELARWLPRPPIPAVLPGEDRQFGGGLFVDLVPSSCWFTNVRSCIDPLDWERLRRVVFDRAGHVCEACGAGPDRAAGRWLEAHERWAYTDDPGPGRDGGGAVQALRRIICLCTWCHQATHYGLAQLRGTDAAAFAHLRTVTGMTERAARAHIDTAFDRWRARSRQDWTLDLRMLTDAGVTLAPPPEAEARPAAAAAGLAEVRQIARHDKWRQLIGEPHDAEPDDDAGSGRPTGA